MAEPIQYDEEELTAEERAALGLPPAAVPVSSQELAEIGLSSPAREAPAVGPAETFTNRAVGNIPLGNLVTNLASAGLIEAASRQGTPASLTPQAKAELAALGVEVPEDPGFIDRYRQVRDTRRERTEAGSQQNPWAGRAGAATGVGLSLLAPLPGARFAPIRGIPNAAAAERTARILSGAATGAGYGGLNALTEGQADLTRGEVGKAAAETASGAVGGAALGTAAATAAEFARPLAGALRRKAIETGRRVIGGDSDIAAATRQALPDEAVLRALQERLIRPFSTTASTYGRIDKAAEELGAQYGQILQRLEELGVTGPRATSLAAEFMRGANMMKGASAAGNTSPRIMAKEARAIGAQGQVAKNLPLSVAESMKRDFQKMGRFERIKNTPGEEAYQELGSRMRQSIEESVEAAGREAVAGSETAELASRFVPTKSRLSDLLAARTVGERGASKAAQKASVGLKDYILGMAAGDPASAALTALASSQIRNRLPSAYASGLYGLSEGLQTGTAAPGLARSLELTFQPDASDLEALAEWLMRNRKDKRR